MRDQIRGLDLAVEYGKNNNSSTWLWLREKKTIALGALGGIILFVYWDNPDFTTRRIS
jgi:hypothetical protein